MITLLITGNTYPLRRQIKAAGGRWSSNHKGWIAPLESGAAVLKIKSDYFCPSLEMTEIDSPEDCFKPMTLEEKRAHIQGIRNRRAERLLKMAENREQKADGLRKEVEPFISDIAFVTQPITQNAGGRSFARFRERINGKVDKRFGLENEADELRARAGRLSEPVAMKGDAEKRKTAEREEMDKIVKVGTKVNYRLFNCGECTVVKVNKKTYTVEFTDKRRFPVDKRFVSVIK